jgi:CDP-glucose 4,6-dehydratase
MTDFTSKGALLNDEGRIGTGSPTRLPSADFWRGQRVLVTGHTGFTGAWTCLWLRMLGATVGGVSSRPSAAPSLFEAAGLSNEVHGHLADVRDFPALAQAFEAFRPTIVLHMAGRLARAAQADPAAAHATNVMGAVHVLELARRLPVVATLMVSTDRCYAPSPSGAPFKETDRLGGRDPYGASKACAELVAAGYAKSFGLAADLGRVGSTRAGNLFGGGEWTRGRLFPDLASAFSAGRTAVLQNPDAVRTWLHVLEGVAGYLLAVEHMVEAPAPDDPPAWNFSSDAGDSVDVLTVARRLAVQWGDRANVVASPHADTVRRPDVLVSDSSRARLELGWRPRWGLDEGLAMTARWHKSFNAGGDARSLSEEQILEYCR